MEDGGGIVFDKGGNAVSDNSSDVRKRSLTASSKCSTHSSTPSKRSSSVSDAESLKDEAAGADTVSVPRNITLLGGVSFIVGTIIGSGIFISPAGVAEGSGSVGLSMVNWVICGLIAIIGAFCYAELGTIIKESGADYSYLHFGYGAFFSYIFSWVNNILVKPASLATIALTCAQYILVLFFDDGCGGSPPIINKLLAIFVMFILAAINIYSVKLASNIQIIFTFAKLVAVGIIIIGGIVKLCQGYTDILATGFEGTETDIGKIAISLYSGMWSYDGWNTANFMTEEMINPERNLPLAIVIGVPLVMVIYILVNISYFTVMTVDELIASPAVAITWAERVMPNAVFLIPIFVALSTFGTGNGSLFSGGRLMFVAARNDHLPEILAMVHVKKFTPVPATIFTIILASLFTIPGDIGQLIDFCSFLMWIFYGMNMFGMILFRFKKKYKDLPRPVKVPIIIPIIATLASIFLVFVPLIFDPQIEFLFAVFFIVVGLIVWLPLVFFKLRFRCMKYVTMFFQLYLQSVRPVNTGMVVDDSSD